ncbi:MAG: ABC transporter permease [Kiritimatiellae bacterium]|nr:ABC transporter permease [Kiritimatiellia bacterium]
MKPAPTPSAESTALRGPSAWQRLWADKMTRFCIVVILIYTFAALYGECVYRYYNQGFRIPFTTIALGVAETPPYNELHMESRYVPPLTTVTFPEKTTAKGEVIPPRKHCYLLGSDNLGRDVLQRLVQGARIAFHVGIMTSLIAIPLGVLLGSLGGYFGGKIDSAVVWLCATVSAMPGLLFILAIAMIAGKGLFGIYLGIGLTTWVSVCRNIRAEVIKHRDRPYVHAAKVLGYSPMRILFRHILPNVMHIVLISFSIRFPASVGTEVFMSFLGIGVQGEPSWGIMINNARARLWQGIWWELTIVSLAIFLLVFIFNRLADALRDVFDPALRNR